MTRAIKICGILFLSLGCGLAHGQIGKYHYKRELKGVSEQWHKIVLPDELFGSLSGNLTDLRIYGITTEGDTVEAPYLLRKAEGKKSVEQIDFKRLNTARDNRGYYFTFEVTDTTAVNSVKLNFKQQNFDWKVTLQGSHDQNRWFTIAEAYRILSIRNEIADFQSTTLAFPESKYRYFRLFIDSEEQPELLNAGLEYIKTTEGVYKDYLPEKTEIREDKASGQTLVDIDLPLPIPLSRLTVAVGDSFDYYRPVSISYLADSVKTEQGWRYQYRSLVSGTLNSTDKNEFAFSSTTASKLRVLVDNHNNQPLHIDSVRVSGYLHELLVRFTEPATYFLTYGSTEAIGAQYDIDRFADKIPETLKPLKLGAEVPIAKAAVEKSAPLFENKLWLWGIMLVIILILGWFSLKMMNTDNKVTEE